MSTTIGTRRRRSEQAAVGALLVAVAVAVISILTIVAAMVADTLLRPAASLERPADTAETAPTTASAAAPSRMMRTPAVIRTRRADREAMEMIIAQAVERSGGGLLTEQMSGERLYVGSGAVALLIQEHVADEADARKPDAAAYGALADRIGKSDEIADTLMNIRVTAPLYGRPIMLHMTLGASFALVGAIALAGLAIAGIGALETGRDGRKEAEATG